LVLRGENKKLYNEELHDLYSSTNVVMVTKSKGMRWAGAGSMHGKDEKYIQNFFVKKPEGTRPFGRLENLSVAGKIILD
jgi:hypothetical protein